MGGLGALLGLGVACSSFLRGDYLITPLQQGGGIYSVASIRAADLHSLSHAERERVPNVGIRTGFGPSSVRRVTLGVQGRILAANGVSDLEVARGYQSPVV